MKLEYKLLWIEDQPSNVDGAQKVLAGKLQRQGFKLDVTWASTREQIDREIESLNKYHNYDLILVDYQLKNGDNGDVIAKEIRRHTKTEIIFYSSAPPAQLRAKIFEQGIDGVYSINRNSIADDAMDVITTTIKKVVDLNHMRGIMMSAVSELDHSIADSLTCYYNSLDESGREALLSKTREKMQKVAQDGLEKIAGFSTLTDVIESYQFSTMVRYTTLQSSLKQVKSTRLEPLYEVLKSYKDTIGIRNDLAHGRLVEQDGVYCLDGKTFPIDEDTFRQARVDLLKHQLNFENIRELLIDLFPPPTPPES